MTAFINESNRKKIIEQFGNSIRIRVCGLCIESAKILMVNHLGLNAQNEFWSPPGGGMEFGHSASKNLIREFLEETGIIIEVEKFLFIHEYLRPPLHAIELFFKVRRIGGKLTVGTDPEMGNNEQIIKEVTFLSFEEIMKLRNNKVHQIFHNVEYLNEIEEIKGYVSL